MLVIALLGSFLLSFGALVGVPLVALVSGALSVALLAHVPAALPYAVACVALGAAAEFLAIHLEAGDRSVLAQAAALLLFGRMLGPLAGAAAWEKAIGGGFSPRPLARVLLARAMRLLGVLGVLWIASLAPAS